MKAPKKSNLVSLSFIVLYTLSACGGPTKDDDVTGDLLFDNGALQYCVDAAINTGQWVKRNDITSLTCDLTGTEFTYLDLSEVSNLLSVSVTSDTVEELVVAPALQELRVEAPIARFKPDETSALRSVILLPPIEMPFAWGKGGVDLLAINPTHLSLKNYNLSRVLDLSMFSNLYSAEIDNCIIYNSIDTPENLSELTLKNFTNNFTISNTNIKSLTLNKPYSYFCDLDAMRIPTLTHLTMTGCENSAITLLGLPALTHVNISDSLLSEIDLSQTPNIIDLILNNNDLGRLDLSPLQGTKRGDFETMYNNYDETYREELRTEAEDIFTNITL